MHFFLKLHCPKITLTSKYTNICFKKNSVKNIGLKVGKSKKHFFLKLHCPKNEQNIRQNSALTS